MSLGTIVLIGLALFLIGAIPAWFRNESWGYGLGLAVFALPVLLLTGRL